MQRDCAAISFANLCRLYEKLADTRVKNLKKQLLAKLFQSFPPTQNLFPIVALLAPALNRNAYHVKENFIARLYLHSLQLAENSTDALRLVHYKDPAFHPPRTSVGDISSIVQDVMRTRASEGGVWSVSDVNAWLQRLSDASGEERKALWDEMSRVCSAVEQKWLVRLVLKDLRLGMRPETILKVLHPKAEDMYNSSADLGSVCVAVTDPALSEDFGVKLFVPLKPMLAAYCDLKKIQTMIRNHKVVVELKFDGERIQIHKKGTEVRFYTRNGIDATERYRYGDVLGAIVRDHVLPSECILDGELVTYDRVAGRYAAFGGNRSAAKNSELSDARQLCFIAFDILFAGSKSLMKLPYEKRRELLRKSVSPVENVFDVVECVSGVEDVKTVLRMLDNAIGNGHEGLLVKSEDAEYAAGERHASKWIKVKADGISGLGETLDVIILGAYYGKGTRRGEGVSEFLLGVADGKGKYLTLVNVGSGYSLAELEILREHLQPHWVKYMCGQTYSHLPNWKPTQADAIPDFVIPPDKSLLLELKGFEIVPVSKKKYTAGYSVRFPSVVKIRYDKPWSECMTLEEVLQAAAKGHGQLYSGKDRHVSPTRTRAPKRGVMEAFTHHNLADVEQQSALFEDLEFCVMDAGNRDIAKKRLEEVIHRNGGEVVMNPLASTDFVVAESAAGLRVKNLVQTKNFNVVKPRWVTECISHRALVPLLPEYVICLTEEKQKELREVIDEYGDSYRTAVSAEELRRVFEGTPRRGMSFEDAVRYCGEDFHKIDYKYFALRGFVFHFYGFWDYSLRANILMRGGRVSKVYDETVTHVVVREELAPAERDKLSATVEVVSEQWFDIYFEA